MELKQVLDRLAQIRYRTLSSDDLNRYSDEYKQVTRINPLSFVNLILLCSLVYVFSNYSVVEEETAPKAVCAENL